MNASKALALTLLLAACGSKDSFAPEEGTWTSTPGASDDGCGIGSFDDGEDAGTVTLEMNSAGDGFTFIPDEDEDDTAGPVEPIDCDLDGMDFTCTVDMGGDEETALEEVDATILNSGTMTGSFSDSTTGELTMEITIDCEGADCGDVASAFQLSGFPCSSSQTYDLAKD